MSSTSDRVSAVSSTSSRTIKVWNAWSRANRGWEAPTETPMFENDNTVLAARQRSESGSDGGPWRAEHDAVATQAGPGRPGRALPAQRLVDRRNAGRHGGRRPRRDGRGAVPGAIE